MDHKLKSYRTVQFNNLNVYAPSFTEEGCNKDKSEKLNTYSLMDLSGQVPKSQTTKRSICCEKGLIKLFYMDVVLESHFIDMMN